MHLGERVFVAGTVGRYGYLTSIQRDPFHSIYYMVHLDGDAAHSGPFVEVWPALKAPEPRGKL